MTSKINIARLDFTRATEKAREQKPLVRRFAERSYAVRGSRGWHVVSFEVAFDGRFVSCDCEHGKKLAEGKGRTPKGQNLPSACYHMAAAASVHVGLMKLAADGAQVPPMMRNPIDDEAAAVKAARHAKRDEYKAAHGIKTVLRSLAHVEDIADVSIDDLCFWQQTLSEASDALAA